ncbi:MAG TPA: carboxypeptidase-like regulatory domain-containing protein [Bryobacteraceae bacterium]|nr:carboxypeptidase-like regulatory domain-containing protein [Bryobacteraceae bacterium]
MIPGAEVALPNTENNVERDTMTNAAGAYAFFNVLPGTSDARD